MAVPAIAAAAAVAYLSAKLRLPNDIKLLSSNLRALSYFRKREKRDRLNMFYLLEEHAQNPNTADKAFLLFEDRSWTFKQFYEMVLRYAGWLQTTHKVTQSEIIALNFINSPEMLFLIVAVWSLGAVPALINYNLTGESLIHSLQTSTARLLIIESEVASNVLTPETITKISSPTFRNNAFPLEVAVLDEGLLSSLAHYKPFRAPDSTRSGTLESSPALLMSTSGTTGLPKQAIVQWLRFYAAALVSAYNGSIRPVTSSRPDTFYTAMPLYHGTALFGGFALALVTPCTLATARRFSVSKFWSDVRQHNVTVIQYVGEALRYLIAAPPQPGQDKNHNLRLAIGNGLRPDVWKRFKQRFGLESVLEFYSATDSTFATWNINNNDFSDGAIGQTGTLLSLMLSRTLSFVRVDWEREEPWRDPVTGFCVKVAPGQPGEAIAKLDPNDERGFFKGYHNNEAASQQKLIRNVFTKGDVYFRSGDVLQLDSEGRLWFSDRIGDTFRWKSENVATTEVGEIIGYHPEVLEANIYGVSVPGHEGRAGCAALLLKTSALEDGKGGKTVKDDVLRSLATYSRNSLQKASVPVFLRVVGEMAATGNHKTVKHILRKQGIDLQALQDAGSGDQIYWLTPEAERYVKFEPEHLAALNIGTARL